MAPPSTVTLKEEQLRKLAKVIYYQEVEAIKHIKFHSEPELAKYLKDCKTSYQTVLTFLDAGGNVEVKFQADAVKASIAHDIYTYLVKAVNLAVQSVRNFTLRLNYLNKISAHRTGIIEALETLDATNVIDVARLAKEASLFNKAILQYNKKYQSIPSKLFSWLTEHGYKFEELVQRYQKLLNFTGAFEDLEDVQKLQVYNKIIEASGLGKVEMNVFEVASGVVGLAVLLFTAGMMVWDIYLSDHKIKAAAQDAVMILAPVGGTMTGSAIGTTLEVELVGLVEVSSVVLSVTGFVVGIIAGIILAEIGNYLVDLIFGSGGSAPAPALPPLFTNGHRCYIAEMPDGEAQACQIAHQN